MLNRTEVRRPKVIGNTTPITTAIASDAVAVDDFIRSEGYSVEILGITTGTVQVQSTIDGTNWTQEGSNVTANGRVNITSANLTAIRLNVTVATTVSITFVVAGKQAIVAGL